MRVELFLEDGEEYPDVFSVFRLSDEHNGRADLGTRRNYVDDSHGWTLWRRTEDENVRLRSLIDRFIEYVSQDRCEGCVFKSRCNNALLDECWQLTEIRKDAEKMGIEVPS